MSQRPRIVKLVSMYSIGNVTDNVRDDVFMPATGNYTFGAALASQTPAATTPSPLAPPKAPSPSGTSSTASTSATTTPSAPKGNFFTKLFGTKKEREARRERRRKNRAERKAARRLRKSVKQIQIETKAKERALALGKSQAEAQAAADAAGLQQKAREEQLIAQAEEKAKADALAKGSTPQVAEDLANAAGEKIEQQMFGGYGEPPKASFWSSMSTGAKVGLIGGGVVVLGLITWGIIAANKK
jgi:hypothetical protein